MPNAELVPCLATLWDEFDAIAPDRDRRSDGWIGDKAHEQTVSDHNDDETGRVPIRDADSKPEVHALDVDDDLRVPGLTMEDVVQHVLARCRSGAERRLRYIIWQHRIWEASNGWAKRAYTGPNGHTQHAHFSASYVTARESDTGSWHLEDIPVALSDTDLRKIQSMIDAAEKRTEDKIIAAVNGVPSKVWKEQLNIEVRPGQKANNQHAGSILRYTSSEHHRVEDKVDQALDAIAQIKANLPESVPAVPIKGDPE